MNFVWFCISVDVDKRALQSDTETVIIITKI